MADQDLLYEEREGVAYITLNRPSVRNCLSLKLSDELVAAIERVRASEDVIALVIQGAGDTFCAGDDITEMPRWGDPNMVMRRVRHYQNMANQLEELDKMTIAAVDGFAVGGGLEITMACDFVIATERAKWGMPEVDVGITPGWGGTTRMSRLIGRRVTKEINLLGALHPARRAVDLTLWNRVVADDALEAEVQALISVLRPSTSRGCASSSTSSTAAWRPTSTRLRASRPWREPDLRGQRLLGGPGRRQGRGHSRLRREGRAVAVAPRSRDRLLVDEPVGVNGGS